jgi:hypothetical protein
MQKAAGTAAKLALAWRLIPVLPAALAKMGSCLSVFLDVHGLRSRVAELEAQLTAARGGGAAALAAPAAGGSGPPAEVLFFPDPAMWVLRGAGMGVGGPGRWLPVQSGSRWCRRAAGSLPCATAAHALARLAHPHPATPGPAATARAAAATTAATRTRAPACCG